MTWAPLPAEPRPNGLCDLPPEYDVAEQEATVRIPLCHDAWLLINQRDELWVSFAVFEFHSEDWEGRKTHQMLFHGEGPSGNLREMRHIWWGESGDGYTFYLSMNVVEAAFRELRKWFD